jgi:acetoin utilization protein AcuB
MTITQFESGKKVITIQKNADIFDARSRMIDHRIRHLPVVDSNNCLIGMVSDRDIRSAMPYYADQTSGKEDLGADNLPSTVAEIMTKSPHYISTRHTLQDALALFREIKVGAFPIVDEERKIVGIISDRDMLNGFIQLLGAEEPGCFMGVEVRADVGVVNQVISALTGQDIAIASMLVLRDWKEGYWAIFLYLLTKNIRQTRRLMTDKGFELLDPMQWFLYRFQADIKPAI